MTQPSPSVTAGLDPRSTDDADAAPDGGENTTGGVKTTGGTHATSDGATTSSVDDSIKFDLGTTGGDVPGHKNCDYALEVTVRDFSVSHPDFEYVVAIEPGIVAPLLGADGLPVYTGGAGLTTTGAENFDQWYRDVDGVNQALPVALTLVDQGDGVFVYDDSEFFPIDGQGFGNEGNKHNYHFTLEMHGRFAYEGGEVFTFRGDDDLFTFVNGHLAIDLGGVHGPLEGSVDLDAMAAELEITPGGTYDIDFFFAERHTVLSNFRIETTLGCIRPPR